MDSLRFHVVEIFPKGKSLNATNYSEQILRSILESPPESVWHRLIIHAGNARLHIAKHFQEFCEQISLRIASHPPCSLDLALSYFFLFGYVKYCLKGPFYPSEKALLDAIHTTVRNDFEGHVQGLDEDTNLNRRTRRSLVSIQ
jgi:hypothetical protein